LQDISLESIIKYRLLEIERAFRRALDKVKGTTLKSPYGEEIKDIFEDVVNGFINYLKVFSDEAVDLRQEARYRRMDQIRILSDTLLGIIEDILSQEASTELYYFLDYYLDLLVDGKILTDRPKILIIKGYGTQTYNLLDLIASIFVSDSDVISKLWRDQRRELWIIEVSPKIEGNVFEWPILLHELAHIVEDNLKIVDTKFKICYWPWELQTGSVEVMEYFHCKEYVCDYIALLLCGPIWLFVLYDLYLLPTYRIPTTHPEWINRVMIVKDRVSSYLCDLKQKISNNEFKFFENIEGLIKFINDVEQLKYEDLQPLQPLLRKPRLLDDIFAEVEEKMTNVRFKIDLDDMLECFNNLIKLEPYISRSIYIVNEKEKNYDSRDIDINVIINSGYLIYRLNIFNREVKEYFEFDDYKVRSEFIYLVSECIRSARIAMIAKEALLS
jgi:hypothetical protein